MNATTAKHMTAFCHEQTRNFDEFQSMYGKLSRFMNDHANDDVVMSYSYWTMLDIIDRNESLSITN